RRRCRRDGRSRRFAGIPRIAASHGEPLGRPGGLEVPSSNLGAPMVFSAVPRVYTAYRRPAAALAEVRLARRADRGAKSRRIGPKPTPRPAFRIGGHMGVRATIEAHGSRSARASEGALVLRAEPGAPGR